MGNFKGDVLAFARRSNMTLDEAHRGIAIKLFSSVVDTTPVDSGQLRGNWNISTGTPNEFTGNAPDPTGSITNGKIRSHKMGLGDRTFLTNAMPYAEVAEYGMWSGPTDLVNSSGYSRKASVGMVRKNMLRIDAIVRGEVPKAKRKRK